MTNKEEEAENLLNKADYYTLNVFGIFRNQPTETPHHLWRIWTI
jgi:hypothetical protein